MDPDSEHKSKLIPESAGENAKVGKGERWSNGGATSRRSSSDSLLSTIQLVSILFFTVTGGPYGFEDVIGASGGLLGLGMLLLIPFVWSAPLALMTGELACMIPQSGGHILWVYHAFGPFWSLFNSVLTFGCGVFDNALYPALFVDYLSHIVYGPFGAIPMPYSLILKATMIAVTTALNLSGVDIVGKASMVFGVSVIAPFVAMFFFAIPQLNLQWISFPTPKPLNWPKLLSVLLWNTSGFDSAGACADEVKDPGRSYPLALLVSVGLMLVTYIVPALVGLSVAPYFELWKVGTFTDIAARVGGRPLEIWLGLGGVASACGLLLTRQCMSSRLVYGMAVAHKAPQFFQSVEGKHGTPWVALVITAFCTLLLSGSKFTLLAEVSTLNTVMLQCMDITLIEFACIAEWQADMVLYCISSVLKFSALIYLRFTEPDAYRPFRIPVGNLLLVGLTAIPLLVCFAMVVLGSPFSHLVALSCLMIAIITHVWLEAIVPFLKRAVSAAAVIYYGTKEHLTRTRQQWMRCVRSLGVVISNTGSRPVVSHSRPLTSLADAPARYGHPSMLGAFSARSSGIAAEIRARNAAQGFRSISVDALKPSDTFPRRHNSITPPEAQAMAEFCGFESVDALVTATVPKDIRRQPMQLGKYTEGFPENEMLERFKDMASKNKVLKSFIGMGYHGTIVPPVILRNLLENPGWYTQYTPYQAEIAQGRLESLLNFQTLITDLTAMPMSNASLLDEGTAAAEAMAMCLNINRGKKTKFYISNLCHPQTIDVCLTRADGLGIEAVVGDHTKFDYSKKDVCGVLVQYPATDGTLIDYSDFVVKAHENGAKVVMATDLLALTVVRPPGELGADMVVGSAQRFGVPMGYGGPHAAFLATSAEYKRLMPGRIIGVSIDAQGNPALRMAMQTREQHIRRDKATSNICTAQALLANMAAMYAVYHGPAGLKDIANRVHGLAAVFAKGVEMAGAGTVAKEPFFDTVKVTVGGGKAADVAAAAVKEGMNLRVLDADTITVAFDETSSIADVDALLKAVAGKQPAFTAESIASQVDAALPKSLERDSAFLTHPIFNTYHSEHELLRYLHRLQAKDLSLVHSMIALGSCTMKLNATAEMIPITWPELANIHPFAPLDQTNGYQEMFNDLGAMLAEITGFDSVSLQPNAGAAGEYAGLMAIRAYHQSRGDHHRNVCIIPVSAHGTNPASAAMCGMKIVAVGTDDKGNVNIAELKAAAEKHKDDLAALMITYPSTHGVYEEGVDEICRIIHANGGQVYMDGANMNAQVGLTSPGHIGADVCHLNLHKTFCIPHGGGGPGMGPIGVKAHLAPFLPSHPVIPTGGIPPPPPGSVGKQMGAIAAAPWGSALILPISFMYIAMMGAQGLTDASRLAILNANYMAKRLESHYPVLFRGANGTCAHEFIIDLRGFKGTAHIEPEDVAKRLMDYGFHAPTMSWPVPGTLMIEPTESESK
ncbi:unnamed protein product, partial [Closterium sp. NIES-53]